MKDDLPSALDFYSQAISMKDHEIYYSNRALVYIDLRMFAAAISDCDVAIKLNSEWTKAYIRKAIATRELIEDPQHEYKALEIF